MKSQARASSQPPPRAKPPTAAIHGFCEVSIERARLPPISENASAWVGVSSAISAMSAPATNALSPAPVRTTTRTSSETSSSPTTWVSSARTWRRQRVELGLARDRDDRDRAVDLDPQGLEPVGVAHDGTRLPAAS